jgi:serine/threonine protein kinase
VDVEGTLEDAPLKGPQTTGEFKDEWMVEFDDVTIGKKIGAGAFGIVYKGDLSGTDVAIKQCALSVGEEGLADFKREAVLLLSLRPHPNIVQVLGISQDGDNIYMIMEYCSMGSLDKLFGKAKLSTSDKLNIIDGVAKGVAHLHKYSIVHRDLAARNILLSDGAKPKVADFGMSRIVDRFEQKGTTAASVGPLRWMAPESIRSKDYSPQSDTWAFAVMVAEIWNEALPYKDMDLFDSSYPYTIVLVTGMYRCLIALFCVTQSV